MERTTNIEIVETKSMLTTIIGNSKLPAAIMQMIVNEIALEVNTQAKFVIDGEMRKYQESLAEQQNNLSKQPVPQV